MSDLESKIAGHAKEAEIKADFLAVVESDNLEIAMVDSDKGKLRKLLLLMVYSLTA